MRRLFSFYRSLILFLLVGLVVPTVTNAVPKTPVQNRNSEAVIEQIDFRDVTLGDALKILADQSNLNIVASKKATDKSITMFLRRVTAMEVIDAISKTYNLWYQRDPHNDIVRIYTVQEYRLETVEYKKEESEIFTMKNNRNVLDLADLIQNLFSKRVRIGYGNNQMQLMMDLQQRFMRFDVVDMRSKLRNNMGSSGGGSSSSSSSSSGNRGSQGSGGSQGMSGMQGSGGSQGMSGMQGSGGSQGMSGMQGSGGSQGMNGMQGNSGQNQGMDTQTQAMSNILERITAEQKLAGEANSLTGDASESEEIIETSLRHEALIYVGVIKDQNRVVVRTRDLDAMAEIKEIAKKLDVQSSMLLMEVKVLQIDLSDGFNSLFDFKIKSGDFNVSSLGGIGGNLGSNLLTNAGAAFSPTLLATVVSNNFEARLQLAENENRVTELATPMLSTTNQEVSRFFIGSEIPILTGYSAGSTTTGGGLTSQAIVQQPTPTYTTMSIGKSMLFTPSINADKTVSVQIVVEQSHVVKDGATILVPTSSNGSLLGGSPSLVPQKIDIVDEKSFSGSVIAKDSSTVAVGGIIEEGAGNQEDKVPFMGDIPLLGFFFRDEAQTRKRTELVIIIKPHIIASPSDGQNVSDEFMKNNSIHPDALGGESLNVYSNPDKQHKGYKLDQPYKEYNNQDSLDRYKWDNPNPRR